MKSNERLTVHEAARELGVGIQQVRRLAREGEVRAVLEAGRWFIDGADVQRRLREEPRPGRPLAPDVAWCVLRVLEDPTGELLPLEDAEPRLRYRVRLHLADPPAMASWPRWLRRRASAQPRWVHPGLIDELAADDRVRIGGAAGAALAGAGVAARTPDTLYVRADDVDSVVRDYRLRDDGAPDVRLMVIDSPWAMFPDSPSVPMASTVCAIDMLDAHDARVRNSGKALISRRLKALKRS